MAETKNINEAPDWPEAWLDDLEAPVILAQQGRPKAVLMSLKDYQHYQALLARQEFIIRYPLFPPQATQSLADPG